MPPASPPASLIKLILVNFNVLLHIRYPHHTMTADKQSILGLDNSGRLLQNSLLAPRTFSRAYMRRSITARTYDQSPRGLAAVDRASPLPGPAPLGLPLGRHVALGATAGVVVGSVPLAALLPARLGGALVASLLFPLLLLLLLRQLRGTTQTSRIMKYCNPPFQKKRKEKRINHLYDFNSLAA